MEGDAKNLIRAWAVVVASLCYCYFVASKIPKGTLRFLCLVPIFYVFTTLPLSLSSPIPIVILSGFVTWLCNFKLLLYTFDLGPLSETYPQKSIITFICFAAFPIKIKDKTLTSQKHNSVLPLTFGTKVVLFLTFDVVYHFAKNMVVLCILMYLFIDIAFGVCDLIVGATLGIELDPPSDEPYLSTSLQDFWGRRWNRMISDTLRHTIHKPVKSTFTNLVGPTWASILGVFAAFVASGLMHELIYYHLTRVKPTWEVTLFFVLHGGCVVLEMVVKQAVGTKVGLHWALSGPLTVGFVMGTGFWLFFPQILRNGVDTKATEDFIMLGEHLKEMVKAYY